VVKTVFNFFCELERVVGVLFETKQHILFVPSAAPESFANVFFELGMLVRVVGCLVAS